MSGAPIRVLYLPNERGDARQSGPRLALAQLRDHSLIEDAAVLSYLWRLGQADGQTVFQDLLSKITEFRPTIVLIQHPAGTGLGEAEWRQLREAGSFRLIYHEGDAYDRFRKRVPAEMRAAAAAADVSFSVGSSRQLQILRAAGSKDARWTPSVFNPHVFGKKKITSTRDLDVVMIANESSSRIPFKSIPGSRLRTRLVSELSRRFGRRFAVYGRGWSGTSARGPLDYSSQEEAIQSAWISTSWDHYTSESNFFSDRLPIALASGTVHVTSSHPGYNDLFRSDLGFIHHERTVPQVVKRIEALLEGCAESDLLRAMHNGREFAHAHYRQDDNLVALLNGGGAGIDTDRLPAAWGRRVDPISEL